MWTRRRVLALGGGGLAALAAPGIVRAGSSRVDVIEMSGTARGEHVWFRPRGLAAPSGTTLRFVNRDPGNSHTSTAYHTDLYDRPRRIPESSEPWDSGFLLPDEAFEVTLERPGVYDYYCLPHELAGMVGRVVVGRPGDPGWEGATAEAGDLPEAALRAFPSVEAILASGRIDEEDHA